MAKQYNVGQSKFIQEDFDEVSEYLSSSLREAFRMGTINLSWCKTYCLKYIAKLVEEGKYSVGETNNRRNRGRGENHRKNRG